MVQLHGMFLALLMKMGMRRMRRMMAMIMLLLMMITIDELRAYGRLSILMNYFGPINNETSAISALSHRILLLFFFSVCFCRWMQFVIRYIKITSCSSIISQYVGWPFSRTVSGVGFLWGPSH